VRFLGRAVPRCGPGWSPGRERILGIFLLEAMHYGVYSTVMCKKILFKHFLGPSDTNPRIFNFSRNMSVFKCFLFSRTFQALKIWKKNSRTFKDFPGPATALQSVAVLNGS